MHKLASRKLWVSVVALVIALRQQLPPDQVWPVVVVAIVYVIAEAFVDARKIGPILTEINATAKLTDRSGEPARGLESADTHPVPSGLLKDDGEDA